MIRAKLVIFAAVCPAISAAYRAFDANILLVNSPQTTVDPDFSAPYAIFGTVGQINVTSNSLYF